MAKQVTWDDWLKVNGWKDKRKEVKTKGKKKRRRVLT